jgi:hypothetical protein
MAALNPTTKPLSWLFASPFLKAVFARAELDGTAPDTVEIYTGRDRDGALILTFRPRVLDGGAAERVLETMEA